MASIATLKDLVDALIQSAKEEDKLGDVTSSLDSFFKLYTSSEDIKNSLNSSIFEVEERKNIVVDICNKAGFSSLVANFLSLTTELGKFRSLVNNKEQILSKLKQASGIIKAEIDVASSITDYDLQRMKDALQKATGKQVEVSVNINPSLIGGIVTRVEDKVFDNSIRTKLEKMKSALIPS